MILFAIKIRDTTTILKLVNLDMNGRTITIKPTKIIYKIDDTMKKANGTSCINEDRTALRYILVIRSGRKYLDFENATIGLLLTITRLAWL